MGRGALRSEEGTARVHEQAKRIAGLVGACGALVAMAAVVAGGAGAALATTAAIVYQSDQAIPGAPAVSHIFVMNTDGQGAPVTKGAANDLDPAWSPDGTRIAFARLDGPDNYNIYVMNADGSGVTRLTAEPRSDRYPAWSPDGSKIAFRGYPPSGSGTQIFTMNPDGSGQAAVPNSAGGDQPSWAPDGKRIAYTLTYQKTDPATGAPLTNPDGTPVTDDDIAVINTDGSGLVNLTNNPSTSDRYPSWSPTNADLILFRRLDPSGAGRELFSITVGSHTVTNLSSNLRVGRAAAWSPDGKNIVFVSYRDPEKDLEIWLSSFDGTTIKPRQLTNNAVTDDEPKWANVPVTQAPVPPSSGGTTGTTNVPPPSTAGGGSITVGGGTTVTGGRALALTLIVPRRERLGRRRALTAFARCSESCTVTMKAAWKRGSGRRARAFRLFKSKHTARANARKTFRLRIPARTLRAIRSGLRHHRRVVFVITATASNSSGEFTPAAARRLRLRR